MFFWNSLAFLMIQHYVSNLISGSSAFPKASLNIWKFTVHILLKPGLENFFFFLMLQKALLFPFGPRLERGLQDVKKLPSGCREGLQAALMLGGFFNGHWSPEAPSCA